MMESPSHIAIVILAAGASKRMGSPKQLLKWGDGTLIGNAIETASSLKTSFK
jgi:molybdenum cofactor cytidylyltransferase